MSNCSNENRVRYSTHLFRGKALTWWNSELQNRGREAAMGMSWADLRALMLEEFCPRNELKKLEAEFWDHTMQGSDLAAYTDRFHELARLCPQMVIPESRRIERFIYGLHPEVRRSLRGIDPPTI
ncbi:MAG: retrotransposon gag domain-containing protein [Candidatus Phytoplasma australasiaticum]|nr:retrotransposon gag domain-containing protein [Candidatus Phytoplasma australasiaticum]